MGAGALPAPLHLLFLFTALQERCTLAFDITLFLLPVGSIFFELQETDSDLDDDLDRLDPDTDHQELRQPVEWLQPSCTSGAKYNADVRSTEREGKIEYPTCSRQFRIDEAFMLMNGPIHSGRSREMVVKVKSSCKIISNMGFLRKI